MAAPPNGSDYYRLQFEAQDRRDERRPSTCQHCASPVYATYRLPDGTPIGLCERHYHQAVPLHPSKPKEEPGKWPRN